MLTLNSPTPLSPSRIVVLGSKGFVGSHLLSLITLRGWEYVSFSSKELNLTEASSSEALSKVIRPTDTVLFISALTPDKGRDRNTLLLNLKMADNVCAALEKSPCGHLIYISSDAVYDDNAHPVRESSPCNPSSFHGVMHLTRERMILESVKKTGIPLLILRPCAVYGPKDTHQSYGPNRFLKTALEKGEISITGEGEELRDHLFIDDLVKLIAECISYKATGILNGASGTTTSFGDAAKIIQATLNNSVKILSTPRQSPVTHRHFDTTEILRTFPTFQMTLFTEGIKKTASGR